jgi:hypothetical protein
MPYSRMREVYSRMREVYSVDERGVSMPYSRMREVSLVGKTHRSPHLSAFPQVA